MSAAGLPRRLFLALPVLPLAGSPRETVDWPLLHAFRHRADLAALGRAVCTQVPALGLLTAPQLHAEMQRRLGVDPAASLARTAPALARALAAEAAAGDLLPVAGWPLLRSEVLLAVLASRVFANDEPLA